MAASKYLLTLLFCGVLMGCSKPPENVISAQQAHKLMSSGQITLIDIRRPEEWRETGVAAGVTRINMVHPQGMTGFAQAVSQSVGNNLDAPIVLICRTGSRTSRIAPILQEMGFTNVRHVPEGMIGSSAGPGWIAQNLPVDPCKDCQQRQTRQYARNETLTPRPQ